MRLIKRIPASILAGASVAAAIVVVLAPSFLDFPRPLAWTLIHPNLVNAAVSLIGIFVTAALVQFWTKTRTDRADRARFADIETIAFRSLSQTVNDVGRILQAPLVGTDVHASGIPGFTEEDHREWLSILRKHDVPVMQNTASGFWNVPNPQLQTAFERLWTDRQFVQIMFRTTSIARRRLQESMAAWAPVMVTVPEANERLVPGWLLADQLVLLAESWRRLRTDLVDGADTTRSARRAHLHFFEAVGQYGTWLEQLQDNARLPSKGYARNESAFELTSPDDALHEYWHAIGTAITVNTGDSRESDRALRRLARAESRSLELLADRQRDGRDISPGARVIVDLRPVFTHAAPWLKRAETATKAAEKPELLDQVHSAADTLRVAVLEWAAAPITA